MAEALGLASSALALAKLTSQIAGYVVSVQGASAERKRFLSDLRQCEFFLYRLHDEVADVDEGNQWSGTAEALQRPQALEPLKEALFFAREKLVPSGGRLKRAVKVLKWPFESKELDRIMATIDRQRNLIELALQNDHR
jgi:hypothetical protein